MKISDGLNEPMIQRRLSDVIYDALLEAVITRSLAPGQLLHDRELAQELQVSRTPVREALQRLHEVGLVEIAPGRYTRVTPIDHVKLADVCRVVGQMVALAVELGTPALQRGHLDRLKDANAAFLAALARADSAEIGRQSRAFYGVFVELADNPVLAQSIARLWPQVARWSINHPSWKSLPAMTAQRQRILSAARARNGERAAELVRTLWSELAESITAAAEDPASAQPA
jgi:DNA-binding GntR family transcriptional regulator